MLSPTGIDWLEGQHDANGPEHIQVLASVGYAQWQNLDHANRSVLDSGKPSSDTSQRPASLTLLTSIYDSSLFFQSKLLNPTPRQISLPTQVN